MYGTIGITASDNGVAQPSRWFNDNASFGFVYPGGKIDCKNAVAPALELWGWGSDYSQFLKDIGYTFDASKPEWYGPGDRGNGETRQNYFDVAVQKKYYTANFSGNASPTKAALYEIYLNAFTKACAAKNLGTIETITNSTYLNWLNASTTSMGKEVDSNTANISGLEKGPGIKVYFSKVNTVDIVNEKPVTVPHGYVYQTMPYGATQWYGNGNVPLDTDKVELYGHQRNAVEKSCHEIQKGVTDNAGAWLAWQRANPDKVVTPPETKTDANCTTESCETVTTSACVVEGVGWIVCPITNFLSGVADASFAVISNFLKVDVSLFDSNSGTATAWSSFRNLANVAFVIVFLIIIFSQLTGQGVTNYGVKKTLPRLVIAAILVNISFFVCQLAVDVTQIIGGSIKDILLAIPVGSSDSPPVSSWTAVMGDILSGTVIGTLAIVGIAGGAAIVALSISGPVLLAALIAVLMTVIILVGRQAAIVILIVISPLAFVAYLLPNTEQWFKRWYKMFFALLMVYPIIALLYGGGQLASKIISSAANADGVADDVQFWLSITAIGVATIPLIMTPALLKGALNGVGTIGTKLSGFASKANGNIKKSAVTSSRLGEAKTGIKNRFALRRAQRRVDTDTRMGRVQQSIDNSKLGRALGLDKGAARALAITGKAEAEETQEATLSLDRLKVDRNEARTIAGGGKAKGLDGGSDFATRSAAIQRVVASNDIRGMNDLWDQSKNWTGPEGDKLRTVFARSLESSGGRPAYYGAGALAALKLNQHDTAKKTVADAVTAGAYSPEKIAKADKDELQEVQNVVHAKSDPTSTDYDASYLPIHQRLVNDAHKALNDPLLSVTLGKNRQNIEHVRNNSSLPPLT